MTRETIITRKAVVTLEDMAELIVQDLRGPDVPSEKREVRSQCKLVKRIFGLSKKELRAFVHELDCLESGFLEVYGERKLNIAEEPLPKLREAWEQFEGLADYEADGQPDAIRLLHNPYTS